MRNWIQEDLNQALFSSLEGLTKAAVGPGSNSKESEIRGQPQRAMTIRRVFVTWSLAVYWWLVVVSAAEQFGVKSSVVKLRCLQWAWTVLPQPCLVQHLARWHIPVPVSVLVIRIWPNRFGNRWIIKIAREFGRGDGHGRSVVMERKCLSSFTDSLLSCFEWHQVFLRSWNYCPESIILQMVQHQR